MCEDVGPSVIPFVFLRVVAGNDVVSESEGARVGLGLLGEDPQQRGLAGAVQPHDQQALPTSDVERDVLEHRWSARRTCSALPP